VLACSQSPGTPVVNCLTNCAGRAGSFEGNVRLWAKDQMRVDRGNICSLPARLHIKETSLHLAGQDPG
jgi:hypothetical protein